MSAIHIENLTKQFPNGHLAVLNLNLHLAAGEYTVLVGPSGCGKTTTLRLLAGLETPTQGRILIDGKDVTTWPAHKRGVAMVFQDHVLYPHLTVRGNLEFPLRLQKRPRTVITKRMHEIADLLELQSLLDHKPSQLSGGQLQRVALGRALIRQPRVCLLDEPLSHLDTQLRVQARTKLLHWQRQLSTTFLHVTHDHVEALYLGDRIAVMAEGKIQQFDTPEEICRKPVNRLVADFLGGDRFRSLVDIREGRLT